ncbi:MAG: phage holin family protein [Acidiferrobacter sp.]
MRAFVSVLMALAYQRYGESILALKDGKQRLVRMMLLSVCAGFFLAGGVLSLSFGVVVFFWNHHRLAAIGGVIGFYWLVAGLSVWRLRVLAKRGWRLF